MFFLKTLLRELEKIAIPVDFRIRPTNMPSTIELAIVGYGTTPIGQRKTIVTARLISVHTANEIVVEGTINELVREFVSTLRSVHNGTTQADVPVSVSNRPV